jgi:hypothetical protein
MSLKLTDKQLNFGKILILESGHGYSDDDLMTLTKASSVQKLAITSRTGIVKGFLHHVVDSMLASQDINESFDLYRINGKKATSVFTSLSPAKFIGAYWWTPNDLKFAHNNCLLLMKLEENLTLINSCFEAHQDLLEAFKKVKQKRDLFSKHTRTLQSLSKNYALQDIGNIKTSIRNLLVNRW